MDTSIISLFLGLICIVLWLIYRHYFTENIFKEAGIRYIGSFRSMIGVLFLFIYSPFKLSVMSYKKNGKLFGQYIFGRPQLNVGDPELIKQVLVKDFQNFVDRTDVSTGDVTFDNLLTLMRGEAWKRVRTVLSPGFSTGKMRKMTSTILDCAETLKKNIDAAASSGEPVELKRFCGAFTMDAIASSAFGTKVDSHNDPNNQFITAAKEVFTRSNQLVVLALFLFSKVTVLFKLKQIDIFGSRFFGKIALQLAEERKSSGEVRNDFLQLLLDALEANNKPSVNEGDKNDEEKELQDNLIDGENDGISERDASSKKVSDMYRVRRVLKNKDEFVSQCLVLFLGGYETVASTIAFAFYELALNEDCQEKLIVEIDDMLKQEREKKLTYENIQTLKYLDAFVSEVLRKYPPATNLQRVAVIDCTLGESNIRIPKGTTIQIPVYALHYDPEYYPNPEKFDPERFSPEGKASRNPYVYLPFGAGPRNCIAMRFALLEVKLCLAFVLKYFRFHRCAKTEVPLKLSNSITQLIASDIFVSVEKRDSLI